MTERAGAEELQKVAGPSALGGGWKRFGDLLYLISVTEFKKTYFGTILGYFWSLLRPLMVFVVLLFVFTQVFRLGSQVKNYPALLLVNLVLFTFFQESTLAALGSVLGQEGIVRKTQFPRLVIPLAVVMTSLFNFGLNLIAVLIIILAFGVVPLWTWLLFPLVVVVLGVFTACVAMLLSSLYVRFRDLAIIWGVLITVLFYGTPVLYPLESVPSEYGQIILLNPLTPLFVEVRHWVIDPNAPDAVAAYGSWLHLMAPVLALIGICVLGAWVFNREAPRIAEEL